MQIKRNNTADRYKMSLGLYSGKISKKHVEGIEKAFPGVLEKMISSKYLYTSCMDASGPEGNLSIFKDSFKKKPFVDFLIFLCSRLLKDEILVSKPTAFDLATDKPHPDHGYLLNFYGNDDLGKLYHNGYKNHFNDNENMKCINILSSSISYNDLTTLNILQNKFIKKKIITSDENFSKMKENEIDFFQLNKFLSENNVNIVSLPSTDISVFNDHIGSKGNSKYYLEAGSNFLRSLLSKDRKLNNPVETYIVTTRIGKPLDQDWLVSKQIQKEDLLSHYKVTSVSPPLEPSANDDLDHASRWEITAFEKVDSADIE